MVAMMVLVVHLIHLVELILSVLLQWVKTPYALVASNDDHGVQIMDITNPAVPIAVASVRDEVDGFDELRGANDITTVQIGSSVLRPSYLF